MAKITIKIDGESFEGEIGPDQSILDFGEAQGLDLPFSCRGGICSTCMAMKESGEVKMDNNMVLTDGEIQEGYILTCQSKVVSDEIVVDYDI